MSKTTEGFEERWKVFYGANCLLGELTFDPLVHARALEKLLSRHYNYCPVCSQHHRDGHSPDCELARLLE